MYVILVFKNNEFVNIFVTLQFKDKQTKQMQIDSYLRIVHTLGFCFIWGAGMAQW